MNEPLSMDQEFISNLTNIVIANLKDENFGVENLAEESGISRITIYRKLKSIRNQDVSQFIREIRLQRAMRLLQNNVGTASEIAYMVGFGSPAYFNKCFHEYYGYPPGQAKKEALKKTAFGALGLATKNHFGGRNTGRIFAFASLILLILGASLYLGYRLFSGISHKNEGSLSLSQEKSIAVLPFRNLSDTVTNQYFIDGIMEDILDNLQKIADFRVLSRTSTDQFKSQERPTIPEIATKLNVNYLVEGSGQRYGNTFRLRVRLINANDMQIWAHSYEEKIQGTSDIFNIQNKIAASIASELNVTITPDVKRLIEKSPTANLTAYDFYQRATFELTNFEINPYNMTALGKAEDLYHKALKYDPKFAQSYVGLAKVYWKKHSSILEYYSENYLDSVLILCNKALTIDNKLDIALAIRGDFYTEKGLINKAIIDYDEALRINPNSWESYNGKGNIYFDDDLLLCIQNFQKAASLNHGLELPVILRKMALEYASAGFLDMVYYYDLEALKLDGDSSTYLASLATGEKYQNHLEKAAKFLRRAYSLDTTQLNTALQSGHCYMFLNQYKETLRFYKRYVDILKTIKGFTMNDMHRIGWAYSKNGYKQEAGYFLNRQLEYSKNEIHLKYLWGQKLYPYYDIAGVYAFTGKRDKAYECLRLFNQRQRMPLWVVTFLKVDPLFENIRNESEFQEIIRDAWIKYEAEHEKVRKWLEKNDELKKS